MNFLQRLMSAFSAFFMETSYVARVYADSLRDNFVGYVPTDPAKFQQLLAEFQQEVDSSSPYFARLLRIEAALIETMPDHVMEARFWAIDDRFQRVVPLATRTRYERSVPARGDPKWQNPNFVRDQQRALLDVIHANYLINIGREKSIKRLKLIILIALIVLAMVATAVINWNPNTPKTALTLLVFAGSLGSMLSVTHRLQAAVSRDAMTEDGIYELTGLRIGWVGVVTSFLMGGAFALVLYGIVMAGSLDIAYPVLRQEGAPTQTTQARSPPPPPALSPDRAPGCGSSGGDCGNLAERFAHALALQDATSFYKMVILAFLAGFAERLVPDILGRLSKRPGSS